MPASAHSVVLYVHEVAKKFTITARTKSAGLSRVDQQMSQPGYTRIVVASGVGKVDANRLRDKKKEELSDKGYLYHARERC